MKAPDDCEEPHSVSNMRLACTTWLSCGMLGFECGLLCCTGDATTFIDLPWGSLAQCAAKVYHDNRQGHATKHQAPWLTPLAACTGVQPISECGCSIPDWVPRKPNMLSMGFWEECVEGSTSLCAHWQGWQGSLRAQQAAVPAGRDGMAP